MAHENKTKRDNPTKHHPNFIFGFVRHHWKTHTSVVIIAAIAIIALGSGSYALFLSNTPQTEVPNQCNYLTTGLVGCWALDGNALDGSISRNDGTIMGGVTPTADRFGNPNGAMKFDGSSSQYIYLGNPTSLQLTGSFTLSGWFKVSSYDEGGIIGKWTSGAFNTSSYLLTTYPGVGNKLAAFVSNGTSSDFVGSSSSGSDGYPQYPLNAWNFVATTFDTSSKTLTLYLNGQIYDQKVLSFNTVNNTSTPVDMGCWGGTISGTTCISGSVDDVRAYNRAISFQEMKELYGEPSTQINSLAKGLMGEWKLNGNAKDSTPYSNNGTASNLTYTAGPSGQADTGAVFNGSSSSVQTTYVQNSVTAFSVSAWIKTASTGTQVIWNDRGSDAGKSLTLYIGSSPAGGVSGAPSFILDSSSTAIGVNSSQVVNDNKWHKITGTWTASTGTSVSSGQFKIYIDGVTSATTNRTTGSALSPLTGLGGGVVGHHIPWNSWFNGVISDVRVYNRVLLADEVKQLYSSYDSQASFGVATAPNGQTVCVTCGLVGYWPLDGNAKDMTPYGDNGALMGGVTPTTGPYGNVNGAMGFNGADSQVSVNSNDILDFGSGGLTISFWIKPTTISSGMEDLMGKFQNNVGGYYITQASDTMLMFTKDYSHYLYSDSNSLAAGKWAHVVYITSPGTLDCYIDSIKCTRTPNNPPLSDIGQTGNDFVIGGPGPYGSRFNGSIADLRIYNRALSANEVAALYNLRD